MTHKTFGQVKVSVVMCTWKRIPNIRNTINDLETQVGVIPELTIWNNNSAESGNLECAIANTDTKLDIRVIHSPENVGGIGRFYAAKELKTEYVIFIDDDQRLPEDFIATLFNERSPTEIHAIWAFKMVDPNNYWNRKVLNAGDEANYCGTGGMVVPTRVFSEPHLFDIPKEFSFIEDLWLSYYVTTRMGFKLYKSAALVIPTAEDENGLWRKLKGKKNEFLKHLVRSGWEITS